ncbi:Single-stranded DNA binding protein [Halorussus gelatinilyticus]|uniref:Single-stranded DNA binding protein n=1 Tax=Halorussus gelatinilyticus TaxID=2937524 RepID=A0A8U0IHG8_9EURY|nr:Single-stranded DNA binding protein [Halorussus gelatinilyticus]UPW00517.1 Single-stranded DNA binding protein [Halorussus gelatinilyticus]
MSLDDHAEDLASDLGVDKEEVKADLENLVEYSVPVDEAKQSLRRKYGDGSSSSEPSQVDLADVSTEDSNVTVTAKVLTVGKRSIRYQGNEQTIHEGELADETGKISYTAWEDFGLSAGDTITAGNAGVREWEGDPELNLGESTNVAFEDDIDVPYPVGGDADLADLEPGDRGINLDVQVVEVETKTIDGRDGETEIKSGVLADESARLPFTDWEARPEVAEGATMRLEDVYVREFRGVPSVNLSEFTAVAPLDRELAISDTGTRMTVRDAVETGGAYDVEVVGSIVAVRDGSGLIERCPECGRVIQNGQCRSHGDVDGQDDLRVKAIVDDGTGTVTAVLDAERTEEVYGGDVEDAKAQARDAMDKEVVADSIRERVVGHEYRVRGNLSVDDYGANLEVTEFERSEDPPADRADALLAEVAE